MRNQMYLGKGLFQLDLENMIFLSKHGIKLNHPSVKDNIKIIFPNTPEDLLRKLSAVVGETKEILNKKKLDFDTIRDCKLSTRYGRLIIKNDNGQKIRAQQYIVNTPVMRVLCPYLVQEIFKTNTSLELNDEEMDTRYSISRSKRIISPTKGFLVGPFSNFAKYHSYKANKILVSLAKKGCLDYTKDINQYCYINKVQYKSKVNQIEDTIFFYNNHINIINDIEKIIESYVGTNKMNIKSKLAKQYGLPKAKGEFKAYIKSNFPTLYVDYLMSEEEREEFLLAEKSNVMWRGDYKSSLLYIERHILKGYSPEDIIERYKEECFIERSTKEQQEPVVVSEVVETKVEVSKKTSFAKALESGDLNYARREDIKDIISNHRIMDGEVYEPDEDISIDIKSIILMETVDDAVNKLSMDNLNQLKELANSTKDEYLQNKVKTILMKVVEKWI